MLSGSEEALRQGVSMEVRKAEAVKRVTVETAETVAVLLINFNYITLMNSIAQLSIFNEITIYLGKRLTNVKWFRERVISNESRIKLWKKIQIIIF